jgi:hypothetical protein
MTGQKQHPDRLEAVERWHSSELDDARVQMARLDAAAAEKRRAVERIQADIENFHSLVREQASGAAPLHAETLLRMSAFNNFQQRQLQSAQDSHRQAMRQADDAQRVVLQLFEQLSVVQRLLERRQELAGKEALRLLQKQLDEGALSRAPHVQNDTASVEDETHGS